MNGSSMVMPQDGRRNPVERLSSIGDIDGEEVPVLEQHSDVHLARNGLAKLINSVAPRFASNPMRMDSLDTFDDDDDSGCDPDNNNNTSSTHRRPTLTRGERSFLSSLMESDDPETIQQLIDRLSDSQIFPVLNEEEQKKEDEKPKLVRRDSAVQQELFRVHERAGVRPSLVLRRLGSNERAKSGGSVATFASSELDNTERPKSGGGSVATFGSNETKSQENEIGQEERSWDVEVPDDNTSSYNPFTEVMSWLDGNEGVEVDDEGAPMPETQAPPFKVLGTAASDVSCHPHVLSPPLMEGLMEFMPESLAETHFWLKYSLVRDGPGIFKLLRSVRASLHTVLAVETTKGFVFGSFTSQPWRLSNGYSGLRGDQSFLWRMRQSRFTQCESIVDQAVMESELEVFPYTQANNAVHKCTRDGIALGGEGELKDEDNEKPQGSTGEHYGAALSLNANLTRGTTSTSETFANPCLTCFGKRGEEFEVANVEVWTLTSCDTVEDAEHEELSYLFFQERRASRKELDVVSILVGSHCL